MADIDFSLLDVPRSAPVDDPEAYLRAAIAWHFGEDTGSAFWLRAARTLNFNPLTDVNTFADLRLFPNLLNELRNVPIEELIPRGYGSPPPIPQIFESGGTTGAPKRTAQLPDWIEQVIEWQTEDFDAGGFLQGRGFVCMMPSGPHGVGYFSRLVSQRLGSVFHSIDLDPRWVKKIAARNATFEVSAYVDRAGRLHPPDPRRGESAHHSPAARGHCPQRPGGEPGEREDPLHAAQRRSCGRRHA
jgi:hypothetical protein